MFLEQLEGSRFGRLVALVPVHINHRRPAWRCRCECGRTVEVRTSSLKAGVTRSCGCLSKEAVAERSRKHGGAKRNASWPEYAVHRSMLARCFNPHHPNFLRYGARGITVCERWRFGQSGKTGFGCFIEDVGR